MPETLVSVHRLVPGHSPPPAAVVRAVRAVRRVFVFVRQRRLALVWNGRGGVFRSRREDGVSGSSRRGDVPRRHGDSLPLSFLAPLALHL